MSINSTSILIVEDEKNIRENMVTLLTMNDYEVRAAASVAEALDCLKTFEPQIIFCDVIMPNAPGYVLLETIRKTPGLSHIPLVFLSAKAEKADIDKAMDMGAAAYITKPFKFADLVGAVNDILNIQ